ncbi:MAG: hypothetical protein GX324_10490 [Aeromonadales bacterium]|nr:hypothetical protein [Aeromonadales bacterium]
MNNNFFIFLLTYSWRWSVFIMFPLLLTLYVQFSGHALSDFDQGVNSHKWLIVGLYLGYVLIWLRLNRRVRVQLEQLAQGGR